MTKIISIRWQPERDGSTQKAQTSGDENEGFRDRKQCSEFLQVSAEVLQAEKTFLSACHSARGLRQACTTGTEARRHSTVQIQSRHGSEATSFAWMQMASVERGDISSHLPDILQSSIWHGVFTWEKVPCQVLKWLESFLGVVWTLQAPTCRLSWRSDFHGGPLQNVHDTDWIWRS